MGAAEDSLRLLAQDALEELAGLDVRRMFAGWGFYCNGLLFAAAWDGEFRFRTRQDGRWRYEPVNRSLLADPKGLVRAAERQIRGLKLEPAAHHPERRRPM